MARPDLPELRLPETLPEQLLLLEETMGHAEQVGARINSFFRTVLRVAQARAVPVPGITREPFANLRPLSHVQMRAVLFQMVLNDRAEKEHS